MNVYRNQTINICFHERSKFPRVSYDIIERLWLHRKGVNGQTFLEIALNLIGNYEFNRKYLNELDKYSFELKTTSGKLIKVELTHGDFDNMPTIKVTEDNIAMTYEYIPRSENSDLLFFDTTYKEYLGTGFTQGYEGYCDKMWIKKDGLGGVVCFDNPHLSNPDIFSEEIKKSTYLVSDKLKEAIINANTADTIELYNTVINNLDEDIKSFYIKTYDMKSYKTLDEIIVSNRQVVYILLNKKYKNGFITIEEDHRQDGRYFGNIDNVKINNDALEELDMFKENFQRKLTK